MAYIKHICGSWLPLFLPLITGSSCGRELVKEKLVSPKGARFCSSFWAGREGRKGAARSWSLSSPPSSLPGGCCYPNPGVTAAAHGGQWKRGLLESSRLFCWCQLRRRQWAHDAN